MLPLLIREKKGAEMIDQGFDPNEHIMKLKSGSQKKLDSKGNPVKGWDGKDTYEDVFTDYLPVQWRLVWFRSVCPHGTIETEMLHLDLQTEFEEEKSEWVNSKRQKVIKKEKGIAVFKATVTDGQGGVATGTKTEKRVSFADFIEKSETGSIGRALAALGYGTQFAPDLDEGERIVDAGVPSKQEDHEEGVPEQPQKPAPAKLAPAKNLPSPQIRSHQDEITLFQLHVTEEEFVGFCKFAGFEIGKPWNDSRYEKAHEVLQQYGAPRSLQEKFQSYSTHLGIAPMQRFAKRVLKKRLADSTALSVARTIEQLDNANFIDGIAKIYDPDEYKELKKIGAKHANGKESLDHPLDFMGHSKESVLRKEYWDVLKGKVSADPEKLLGLPADLRAKNEDALKRMALFPKNQSDEAA